LVWHEIPQPGLAALYRFCFAQSAQPGFGFWVLLPALIDHPLLSPPVRNGAKIGLPNEMPLISIRK
jgi:hypothetical protein